MKGLTRNNLTLMHLCYAACNELDNWLCDQFLPASPIKNRPNRKQARTTFRPTPEQIRHPDLRRIMSQVPLSHYAVIFGAVDGQAERYFYLALSARNHWSIQKLRRQIREVKELESLSIAIVRKETRT